MSTNKPTPTRECLPVERPGFNRRFHIVYHEKDEKTGEEVKHDLKFYIQPGMYPDGRLGEVFIKGDKMGVFISGALDAMATMLSIGLQHGIPLTTMTSKLRNSKFGPAGWTGDGEFKNCTSLFDLIAQYLDATFPHGMYKNSQHAAQESSSRSSATEKP